MRRIQSSLFMLFLSSFSLNAHGMPVEKHPFLTNDKVIKWNTLKPKYIAGDVRAAIDLSQKNIDKISSLPLEELTFDNVVIGMEFASAPLDIAWGLAQHIDGVCNSDETREAINEMLPEVSEFSSSIILNDALWLRIKTFSQSDAAKNLSPLQQRMLKDLVDSFTESGADLPTATREHLKNINLELSQLTQKFGENCLDARNAWEKYVDDEQLLSGLPETIRTVMKDDAKNHGKTGYRISLSHAIAGPCMQYLDNEELRKEIFDASSAMCRTDKFNNTELVKKIIALRDEKVKILGFANYADYKLKHRMAKNGQIAMHFVENLHDKIVDFFNAEISELEHFQTEVFSKKSGQLDPWDIGYLGEKLRQKKFDFNADELRKYFSVNDVINGLFELANKLYGIKFVERTTFFSDDENAVIPQNTIPVWHADVKYYDVFGEDNTYIGSFYTDWHPRQTKQEGAWCNPIVDGGMNSRNEYDNPIGVICGNLTPSTADNPSLLTHGEVETIFHEFGHLLHNLFGQVEYKSMNGTNVAWDFVELPSQIMENFCWDRTSVDMFAKDYQTGEKIPQPLFDKMMNARNHLSALGFMRQLTFAKLDLELHTKYSEYKDCDIEEKLQTVLSDYMAHFSVKVPTVTNTFGHVFGGGYAAGYYSYKWAELLDADAFTQFKADGVISRKVGEKFRKEILSKGDSEDADVLYRNFMGRDPIPEPLLERSGLLKK